MCVRANYSDEHIVTGIIYSQNLIYFLIGSDLVICGWRFQGHQQNETLWQLGEAKGKKHFTTVGSHLADEIG